MSGVAAAEPAARSDRREPAGPPPLHAVPQRLTGHLTDAAHRTCSGLLPVLPAVAPLLPAGALRRGSTVTVDGSTALLLALLAGPSAAGAWCAVVGVPTLGLRAAAELGIALHRLALVPAPGAQWSTAVAALLDGVDVVAVCPGGRVGAGEGRRLSARARERGAVLVPFGAWEGADVRLSAAPGSAVWAGAAQGTGRLRTRRLEVRAQGRGAASRPRRTAMWLPGPAAASAPALEPPAVRRVEAV